MLVGPEYAAGVENHVPQNTEIAHGVTADFAERDRLRCRESWANLILPVGEEEDNNRARMLLTDLRAREQAARETQDRSSFAGDRGRQFREEMRKRMRAARFNAYFDVSQIYYAGESEILVRTQTAERVLNEEGRDLLERLKLALRYAPQAFTRVRQPTWDDDTPEEREEIAAKFNRLKEAMAKGEDLKRLRASGEI